MRLAIIAAAGAEPRAEPLLGERDASIMKMRLGLEDLGFECRVVDPEVDLAEQLDTLLDDVEDEVDELLFYASCLLTVTDDDLCYLCLNPNDPNVGDAVADVAAVLNDRAAAGCLLIIEGRYDDPDADATLLREVGDTLRHNIAEDSAGIEVMVALRPTDAHPERIPSRLTAALLEAIDAGHGPLPARQAYAAAVQSGSLGDWPSALVYVPGSPPFVFRADAPSTDAAKPEAETVEPEPEAEEPEAEEPEAEEPEAEEPEAEEPEPAEPEPAEPEPAEPEAEEPEAEEPEAEEPEAKTVEPEAKTVELAAPPAGRRQSSSVSVLLKRQPRATASALPKVVIGGPRPSPPDGAATPAGAPAAKRASSVPPPLDGEVPVAIESAPSDGELLDTLAEAPAAKRASSHPPPGVVVDDQQAPPSGVTESAATVEAPPPKKRSKVLADWAIVDHIQHGDEALEAGDWDDALKRYKRGLSRLGTKVTPERGAIYVRIGEVMRGKGKIRVAISNFDKALGIIPDNLRALNGMMELNAEQGNWRAVQAAEERYLEQPSDDGGARVDFLLASAVRWQQAADHTRRAKERLTSAQEIAPEDGRVLRALLSIAEQEQNLETVVALRGQLAEQVDEPREKAKLFYELGEYCLFEVSQEREAIAAFESALDADPTMLEALEVLASALAEAQEWGELERIYQNMIERHGARDDETAELVVAELHHRLALLYRDHFEDPESAAKHLEEETKLRPNELLPRLMLSEIAVERDDAPRALQQLEAALRIEPQRADTLHRIFGLARRSDDGDRAFLVAATTAALESADDRERVLFREMRREGVPMHRRAIRRGAWGWLRDGDRDRTVEAVMAAIAPAVLRTRVLQLETEGKLPKLDPKTKQDPATSTLSAVRSLAWGAKFLGVSTPEIYLDEHADGVLLAPFAKQQSSVIAGGALSGRTLPELAFLVGRHLALRLPEHELVAHIQSIDELSVCFLASVKMVLGQVPATGPLAVAAETLASLLVTQQPTEEREQLEQAVQNFSKAGGRVDLSQWVTSVELCARRAGLLLCGDLDVALRLVRGAGDTAIVSTQHSVDDLCVFMSSTPHLLLRQETGCASDGDALPPLPALAASG